jgi:hypothetical protein
LEEPLYALGVFEKDIAKGYRFLLGLTTEKSVEVCEILEALQILSKDSKTVEELSFFGSVDTLAELEEVRRKLIKIDSMVQNLQSLIEPSRDTPPLSTESIATEYAKAQEDRHVPAKSEHHFEEKEEDFKAKMSEINDFLKRVDDDLKKNIEGE